MYVEVFGNIIMIIFQIVFLIEITSK
jgi:hypothetical protein